MKKDYISIEWHIEDVLHQAKEMKVKITKKEARDVLSLLESEHDATIGINWDTIEHFINYVVIKRS